MNTQRGKQNNCRNLVVVMAMMTVAFIVSVDMAVLDSRGKVFQQLLQKKPSQHKQPNQLYFPVLNVKFRQNMNHSDAKQVRPRKYQQ